MIARNLAVEMPLGEWLVIDAVMDNTGRHAIDTYDQDTEARAYAIRELGWSATGHITRPIQEAGAWPPPDDVMRSPVSVSLTITDWRFVHEHLLVSSRVADTIGYTDEAARERTIAAGLLERLDDPTVDTTG